MINSRSVPPLVERGSQRVNPLIYDHAISIPSTIPSEARQKFPVLDRVEQRRKVRNARGVSLSLVPVNLAPAWANVLAG